jgi:protein tyrosine phosphatase
MAASTFRPTKLNYNSAFYQNGFMEKQKFIIVNTPKCGKEDAFFDLIIQQRVRVVVMLGKMLPSDNMTINRYWKEFLPCVKSKYTTELHYFLDGGNYMRVTVQLKSAEVRHTFNVLHYNIWKNEGVPFSAKDFSNFVIETRFANRLVYGSTLARHPIIVHCDGGVGLAAMYCAIEIGMDQGLYTHGKVNAICCIKKLLPQLCNVNEKQIKFIQLLFRNYVNKNNKN